MSSLKLLAYFSFQLSRLSELEEMVVEQDNALAVAAEKYKKTRNEITEMKKENEEKVNKLKQEIARSLSVFRVTFYLFIYLFFFGGGERDSKFRSPRLTAHRNCFQKFTFSIFCPTL